MSKGDLILELDRRRKQFIDDLKEHTKRGHRMRVDYLVTIYTASITILLKQLWRVE